MNTRPTFSETDVENTDTPPSASVKHTQKYPEHKPEDEGEVFKTFIPKGVRDIVLDYFDNDVKPIEELQTKEKGTAKQYDQFKMFGRSLKYFINRDELTDAANRILQGDEKNIAEVLFLIKNKPLLLHIPTEGVDPLNRHVKGKLLEIAAMAGDVNLKNDIHDEINFGLVERLALAGKLSKEEISEQLKVLTDEKAIQENARRNQLILKAIDQLMERILKVKLSDDFKEFKNRCKLAVDQFEKDLKAITIQSITSGFIFDPDVIHQVALKFESKIKSFGGWFSVYSGVFWVNGFGMLQKQLSARDAQIAKAGIKNFIEKHKFPLRVMPSILNLGYNHYLDYQGKENTAQQCQLVAPSNTLEMQLFGNLAASKNKSISKLSKYQKNKALGKSHS